MSCKLCGEPIANPGIPCPYCGHRIVIALDEPGEQAEEIRLQEHRNKLLDNIAEVGVIAYSAKQIFCPLLQRPAIGATEWLEQRYLIYNSPSVASTLYMKKVDGKQVEFNATLAIPAEFGKFQIGAKINNRLKLELYYRKPNTTRSDKEFLIEEIKLGESL